MQTNTYTYLTSMKFLLRLSQDVFEEIFKGILSIMWNGIGIKSFFIPIDNIIKNAFKFQSIHKTHEHDNKNMLKISKV